MNLTIRQAVERDLERLARFNYALIRDEGHSNRMTLGELQQRMADWLSRDYRVGLFEQEEQDVGYVLFRIEEEYVYIRHFFVVAEYRRRGIGREALRLLRESAWPRNLPLRMDVLIHNEAAIRFWRAVGFVDYGLTLESPPAGA